VLFHLLQWQLNFIQTTYEVILIISDNERKIRFFHNGNNSLVLGNAAAIQEISQDCDSAKEKKRVSYHTFEETELSIFQGRDTKAIGIHSRI
jgi:hypothetical protein